MAETRPITHMEVDMMTYLTHAYLTHAGNDFKVPLVFNKFLADMILYLFECIPRGYSK